MRERKTNKRGRVRERERERDRLRKDICVCESERERELKEIHRQMLLRATQQTQTGIIQTHL